MTSPPPNFCDVILSKLCFNSSHWFYAMPTNRQLDNSFPVVLDIFGKGLNLPAPLDIQWPKCFQLQGGGLRPPWPLDQGLCLWTPLGAVCPLTPVIGSCSTIAMVPPNHWPLPPPMLANDGAYFESGHWRQMTTTQSSWLSLAWKIWKC